MIVSRCSSFVRRDRAGFEERVDLAQVGRGREADHATSGQAARSILVASTPSSAGQPEVHHDDVRVELETEIGDLRAVPHRADHVDVRAQPEQELERLPEHVVVLDQGYADGSNGHARTLGSYSADTNSG